jgi:co-chaperonin GroES (HSP10)
MKRFRPLGNRVYAKREELPNESIIIEVEESKVPANSMRVLAVSSDKSTVKVGDLIYVNKYVGTPLDEEHVVVFEQDILGVIE